MFKTIGRIIHWCGEFRGKLYLGFLCSFLSHIFTAMPIMVAAYTVGLEIKAAQGGESFDCHLIGVSFWILLGLVFLRFLFDYLRSRLQEEIGYELVARDRLAIGDALKRVSLGYFQQMSTGSILNSITTGLSCLESMGIRMMDTFIGGYLSFLVIFLNLLFFAPITALIALVASGISFIFLLSVSYRSVKNAPRANKVGKALAESVLEYIHGLPTVKSFRQGETSLSALRVAVRESRDSCLNIEFSYTPANCAHLLALKVGSVALACTSCFICLNGKIELSVMLMFVFFSFSIFTSLEPISDSAHTLGVIDAAMDQVDALKMGNYIDADGKEITLSNYDIQFKQVGFGYGDGRTILKDVTFQIPEKTSCAIVGPSGSGKSTIFSLLARFYDVNEGSIVVGGHDVREFTCESLLENISMVFQNVYLFQDTIRQNICFGRPNVTQKEMIEAAKKACCHEFIMALPNGYDTVIGEGGGTLSGGEKQRISIARAILKNASIIILDEATASIDPENEHLIQNAISELTKGKTIITIAHRLATIEQADQILVVDEGHIVQCGIHKELVQIPGKYLDFFNVRKKAEGFSI
ncbi:ABC transporter ATP-binding protein [Clostridium cadaveris]|uniref:ABC transporter ATP-binding protein n=1 Tax=Clostridium cadaveris TaxID=1529 RepID=UPI0015B60C7E|nr:ABC transporter ATP-binding protein [Clostridium cadaveris]NWK09930.1 ABC transporter ATP-binding protein [Clostridium cadaveris]